MYIMGLSCKNCFSVCSMYMYRLQLQEVFISEVLI